MRRARPLVMTALVFLFLAEAQRAFVASLFGMVHDTVVPAFRPVAALVAILPLALLLGPYVPLARLRDRRAAVAVGAASVAVFRLPMTYPALETRLAGGGLVLAGAAIFLMWAVGHLERSALTGGAVAGLVADQLLRLGGLSYDLTLRLWWFPVQAGLSALLVGLAIWWSREGSGRAGDGAADRGLERRGGGLRLRGALALGALLFIDLHVLGAPPVVARTTGVGYAVAAAAVSLAGAGALVLALVARRPTRSRGGALAMTAIVTAALLAGAWVEGPAAAVFMAVGHGIVLLLITRALEPASGRREAKAVVSGFAVLTGATALYAMTFYPAGGLLAGARPWLFGAVGLLVAGCFILMPRPAELEYRARPPWAAAVGGAAAAIALLLMPGLVRPPPGAGGGEVGPDGLTVAALDVHYGFDRDWTFDPERLAETLATAGVDVVALRNAPAGLPTAYGMDLPLWLGHRLGASAHVRPGSGRLQGDAILSRVAAAPREAVPSRSDGGETGPPLRLDVRTRGGMVRVHALSPAAGAEERLAAVEAALRADRSGPVVLLGVGDLDGGGYETVTATLRGAGFRDALAEREPARPPTPTGLGPETLDRIWVRGMAVAAGRVLPAPASDRPGAMATLQIPPSPVR